MLKGGAEGHDCVGSRDTWDLLDAVEQFFERFGRAGANLQHDVGVTSHAVTFFDFTKLFKGRRDQQATGRTVSSHADKCQHR